MWRHIGDSINAGLMLMVGMSCALTLLVLSGWFMTVATSQGHQGNADYTGFNVISVGPLTNNLDVFKQLIALGEESDQVIVMDDVLAKDGMLDLAISPNAMPLITDLLMEYSIPISVVEKDLGRRIRENNMINHERKKKDQIGQFRRRENLAVSKPPAYYMDHAEINAWLETMTAGVEIANTFSIGLSYEGRDMLTLAINDGADELPAVWLDAGIHAREWIAPATCIWLIHKILTGNDSDAVFLRTRFRWYILPMANPDGYEYTKIDRIWRKSRSQSGNGCYGVDLNRNFDVGWGEFGVSVNPCDRQYCGSRPFSEPETSNIRDAILNRNANMIIFLSLHSYGQLWLVPWAGKAEKPDDYPELKRVGDIAAEDIFSVTRTRFQVGAVPDILYIASGGSFDWAKEKAGIKFAYTAELRPENFAGGGFLVGPEMIDPSGQDIFAGLAAIARELMQKTTAEDGERME